MNRINDVLDNGNGVHAAEMTPPATEGGGLGLLASLLEVLRASPGEAVNLTASVGSLDVRLSVRPAVAVAADDKDAMLALMFSEHERKTVLALAEHALAAPSIARRIGEVASSGEPTTKLRTILGNLCDRNVLELTREGYVVADPRLLPLARACRREDEDAPRCREPRPESSVAADNDSLLALYQRIAFSVMEREVVLALADKPLAAPAISKRLHESSDGPSSRLKTILANLCDRGVLDLRRDGYHVADPRLLDAARDQRGQATPAADPPPRETPRPASVLDMTREERLAYED